MSRELQCPRVSTSAVSRLWLIDGIQGRIDCQANFSEFDTLYYVVNNSDLPSLNLDYPTLVPTDLENLLTNITQNKEMKVLNSEVVGVEFIISERPDSILGNGLSHGIDLICVTCAHPTLLHTGDLWVYCSYVH